MLPFSSNKRKKVGLVFFPIMHASLLKEKKFGEMNRTRHDDHGKLWCEDDDDDVMQ